MLGVTTAAETSVTGVVAPDQTATVAGAYPLTQIVYATVDPAKGSDHLDAYAALLRYAGGDGQEQGDSRGQLPDGYAPLTEYLRAQAVAAADQLLNWSDVTASASVAADGSSNSQLALANDSSDAQSDAASASASQVSASADDLALATPVAQTSSTSGITVGLIRFILAFLLAGGVASAVAGPTMLRFAKRRQNVESQ